MYYKIVPEIILIAHNIRSTHNVGSIFRTAEGFGVNKIICSGYTPHPTYQGDTRLPHLSDNITRQIHKTALGAESLVPFEYQESPKLDALRQAGFTIVGLEQDSSSVLLNVFSTPQKIALILGEEVNGIDDDLRKACDILVEIPMRGKKESFNVSVAAGIALYGILYR